MNLNKGKLYSDKRRRQAGKDIRSRILLAKEKCDVLL